MAINVGQIVSTTLRNRSDDVADAVSNNNALLAWMRMRGNIKLKSGGRTIFQPIRYQGTGNYKRYSGYELLDISIQDVIDGFEYNWKQAATSVSMSGLEMLQNSGEAAVLDLLEQKIEAAEDELVNGISNDIYSNGTADGGRQIGGLQLLIADTPTSGVIGGINRATTPQIRNVSFSGVTDGGGAVSSTNIVQYMAGVYNRLVRGKDQPDLILVDNNYMSLYEGYLAANQRFSNTTKGDAGFVTMNFKGADMVLDGGVYDPTFGYTGMPTNHMYFINTKYLQFITHEDRNFEPIGGNRQSVNQDATVKITGWAGNLTTNNPKLLGVLRA